MNKNKILKKMGKMSLLLITIFLSSILSSGLIFAVTNCGSSTCGAGINNCNNPSYCSNSCYNCYQQHVDAAGCRQYAVGMVKCFIDSCKDGYADVDGNWANGCEQKVACGTDGDCNSPGPCQISPGHCTNGNTVNAQCSYDFASPKNISDESGNSNNGVVYCASSVAGQVGNAINFNGINTYIDLGDKESLKPKKVTISAWIKTSSSGNQRFIAGFGNLNYANPQGYWIGMNDNGNAMFYIGTTSNYDYTTVSNVINNNQWHYMTETYDGITGKLYIDGILAGSSEGAKGDITYAGLASFKIGKIDSSIIPIFNWSGFVDEVKIWNRALTENEILNEYQNRDFRASKICSLGENKIIENSDAQVKCLNLKKFISGNELTINWALILKNSSLAYDNYSLYPYAKDSVNSEVFRDGGNINFVASASLANRLPAFLPLIPSSGESFPDQEVNFSYGCLDPDGLQDLIYCNLFIFGNETYPLIPIFLSYFNDENKMILFNETNNSIVAGNCTPGTSIIIENKNSKIDCSKIYASKSGTNVSLRVPVVFKENLAGKTYSIEPYAKDKAQPNHVVYEIKGNWIVKNFVRVNSPPVANSMNPSNGEFFINEESAFNFDYSDPNGFTDIISAYTIIDSNVSDVQKVLTVYYPGLRKIEIRDNSNNSQVDGNCTIGENATIGNYYTNISCLNSGVSGSGETIILHLSFIFKDKFIGPRKVFIKAFDANGTSSTLKEAGNITLLKRMPSNCTDSDGGKNYTLKGVTNGTNGNLTDSCVNTTTLKEYYCNNFGDASFISYKCPQTCSSGKCIEAQTSPVISPSPTPEPDLSEVSTSTEPETTEPESSQVQGKTAGEIVLWAIIWGIILLFCIILIYLIYSLSKKRDLRKKSLNKVSNPVVKQMPPRFYRPPFRR